MTVENLPAMAPAAALPGYPDPQRVTAMRVLRSKWTKLRTLRSSAWSLLVAAALIVAVGVLLCMARSSSWRPSDASGFDPTATSLTGVYLAQVAIGSLGVLMITGEYASGLIRLTLAAVPRRLPVLWAKALALAALSLAVCVPALLTAFLAGQHVLAAHHVGTALGRPGTVRALLGGALLLVGVGLLGLGLGGLLRNTAAALTALWPAVRGHDPGRLPTLEPLRAGLEVPALRRGDRDPEHHARFRGAPAVDRPRRVRAVRARRARRRGPAAALP